MNVRASSDSLLRFLTSELNYIDVHLCTDEFSLGSALVDYSTQLNKAFHYHNFETEPLVFHEWFAMKPSGATGGQAGGKVKVSISIRRDHLPMTPAESPIKSASPKVPVPAGQSKLKVSATFLFRFEISKISFLYFVDL